MTEVNTTVLVLLYVHFSNLAVDSLPVFAETILQESLFLAIAEALKAQRRAATLHNERCKQRFKISSKELRWI